MIQEVQIRHYRSIAGATVRLSPVTVLTGPNGSGKSNFLDALRFVSDAVQNSLHTALDARGGIRSVRRRSRGHPTHFGIKLVFDLPEQQLTGDYAFDVCSKPDYGYEVGRESCHVVKQPFFQEKETVASFEVEAGSFVKEVPGVRAKIESTRLALPLLSALPEFTPVHDFLCRLRFYSIAPDQLRGLQDPDDGLVLRYDGSNLASVVREMERSTTETFARLCEVLERVVPGTVGVKAVPRGNKLTLEFRHEVDDEHPWRFDAFDMSDGTLRVLGILIAIAQNSSPALIGVEEPEATIHPGAILTLIEALKELRGDAQVLMTTHSPEVMDCLDVDEIRVVSLRRGSTSISEAAEHSKKAIQQELFTPGELWRANGLDGAIEPSEDLDQQLKLFES